MTTTLATSKDPVNAWVEAITPASLFPTNLYEAQLARRLAPPIVTADAARGSVFSPKDALIGMIAVAFFIFVSIELRRDF